MTEIARGIALEPNRAVEKKISGKSQIRSHVDLQSNFTLFNKSKFGTLKRIKIHQLWQKKMIKKKEKTQVINSRNKKDI